MLQTTAIRSALRTLFKQKRLPDNPYFFLASVLGAYVDQSPLWRTPDVEIAAAYDLEGGVEVLDAFTKLCRVMEHSAYGLPHVMRLVSKDGTPSRIPVPLSAVLLDLCLPQCCTIFCFWAPAATCYLNVAPSVPFVPLLLPVCWCAVLKLLMGNHCQRARPVYPVCHQPAACSTAAAHEVSCPARTGPPRATQQHPHRLLPIAAMHLPCTCATATRMHTPACIH
jgi:hypothetical protein